MPIVRILPSSSAAHAEVAFAYDREIVGIVRAIRTSRWLPRRKRWRIERTALDALLAELDRHGITVDLRPLEPPPRAQHQASPALAADRASQLADVERELKLRRYSARTRRAYLKLLRRFLCELEPGALDAARIRAYVVAFVDRDISAGYHSQLVAALRFFCEHVLHDRALAGAIPTPRRQRALPAVLSVEEVRRLFEALGNPKHRVMALLLYSAGVRVGELVRLRVADLDADRELIRVRQGKGSKDRYTLYSDTAAAAVRHYRGLYLPTEWLFTGARPGRPISARTVQKVLSAAGRRAAIEKRVTPHVLRHSFATHLLEQGIGLRYIQDLLGHASPATTEVYTHVTRQDLVRIRSPLDTLGLPTAPRPERRGIDH